MPYPDNFRSGLPGGPDAEDEAPEDAFRNALEAMGDRLIRASQREYAGGECPHLMRLLAAIGATAGEIEQHSMGALT